ncbi:MAG: hypothetical protein JWP10_1126 [Nocardioidaceae bacterium]|nr:hypothetical protein [Nocardioidaceae bacterium]
MSKRRVSPKRARGPLGVVDNSSIEVKSDGEWHVRLVTGSASTKDYRCPGCEQLIRPATPHMVIWPVQKALLSDSALDERRHWHTHCWRRKH